MTTPLAPGQVGEIEITVTANRTADAMGNRGGHVLATPPVGMKVRAKATGLETDGKRVVFQVEAFDEKEKIAEGRHERFMVGDMARFLDRAMKKGQAR